MPSEATPGADAYLSAQDLNRVKWRCRRGLLENDLLIERFFAQRASHRWTVREADALMQLMNLSDGDLLNLLMRRTDPEGELDTPDVRALLAAMQPLQPGSAAPHR